MGKRLSFKTYKTISTKTKHSSNIRQQSEEIEKHENAVFHWHWHQQPVAVFCKKRKRLLLAKGWDSTDYTDVKEKSSEVKNTENLLWQTVKNIYKTQEWFRLQGRNLFSWGSSLHVQGQKCKMFKAVQQSVSLNTLSLRQHAFKSQS